MTTEWEAIQACEGLLRARRADEAATRAEAALRDYPECWPLWHLLGAACLARGNLTRAVEAVGRAVAGQPAEFASWNLYGVILQRSGRRDAAAEAFARCVELAPESAAAWSNASACAYERRLYDDAEAYAKRALDLAPGLVPARLALGNALLGLRRLEPAMACFRRVVEREPENVKALLHLGNALSRSRRAVEAAEVLTRVAALRPRNASVRGQLATVLYGLGRSDEALDHFRAAIDFDPGNLQVWSAYLFALSHHDGVSPEEMFAAHRRFGEVVEAPWCASWGGWTNSPDPERRLRVGFVSADLRTHVVAYFIEPIWEALTRDGFELHAYHNYPFEREASAALRAKVHAWSAVHELSDEALAAQIRADEIDILIDLSGHTGGNRLGVFARKPAPLQLSWIGYPATTGMTAIDYRPVIASICPPGLDAQFSEHLLRMGDSGAVTSGVDLPPVSPLPALKRGHITFGSFNRPTKLTTRTLKLWAATLRRVTDARLLIGAVSDDETRARIAAILEVEGIAPERVEYRGRMPIQEYLAAHSEVDLLLDTVPYGGGTTTSHAVWMGVPTLTLVGPTYPQRSGAWRMFDVGLDDWVCESEAGFVEQAAAVAADPQALARIRASLRGRMEVLLGASSDRSEFGDALRRIWRRWCVGEPARPLDMREDEA